MTSAEQTVSVRPARMTSPVARNRSPRAGESRLTLNSTVSTSRSSGIRLAAAYPHAESASVVIAPACMKPFCWHRSARYGRSSATRPTASSATEMPSVVSSVWRPMPSLIRCSVPRSRARGVWVGVLMAPSWCTAARRESRRRQRAVNLVTPEIGAAPGVAGTTGGRPRPHARRSCAATVLVLFPRVITMATDFSLRPYAAPFRTAVHATARRALERIALARLRAQPKAVFIARLTATAVFAYLLTWFLSGTARSVLAPLTAVLVVQATAYQTVRSAFQRVVSVTAGVLVALAFSAAVGLTWWSLGLIIVAALLLGSALKLGEHMLEVPISAMLILSVDTGAAASGRIVDTLVGAAAGLVGGVLLSPERTQPAEDAIGNVSRQMADLLE